MLVFQLIYINLYFELIIMYSLGKNTRNGGSPPKDNNDVNIMNCISVASLFAIMVWLMNDAPDNLIADTTVSVRVEIQQS